MDGSALLDDVERARGAFMQTLAKLDPGAIDRPIEPGRWSPLEYLEHLVRAEDATVWRMYGAVGEARAGAAPPTDMRPEAAIERIVEETWQEAEEAPPLAVPSLRGSPAYWTARLEAQQPIVSRLVDCLDDGELDGVAYLHPISGPFTMRQGLQFIRFHLDRHRCQIEEALLDRVAGDG